MTSQIGSFPRAPRSPAGNDRSVATGTVRSAILTYLGQIVIQDQVATKGSYPGARPEPIAPKAQPRSHGGGNIPGVGPRRKSIRPAEPSRPRGRRAVVRGEGHG